MSTVTVTAAATDTNATVSISDGRRHHHPRHRRARPRRGREHRHGHGDGRRHHHDERLYRDSGTRGPPGARTADAGRQYRTIDNCGWCAGPFIQSLAIQFTIGSSANRWSLTGSSSRSPPGSPGWHPPSRCMRHRTESGRADRHPDEPAFAPDRRRSPYPRRRRSSSRRTRPTRSSSSPRAWSSTGSRFRAPNSTAEDSGGTAGWQIADTGLTDGRPGMGHGEPSAQFAVTGTADSGDATLSALTLGDADDGDIALDPAFDAGMTEYTASVAHSVNSVTVQAAANHDDGTVSISNDDDDATPGTAELDLDVGENTVAVTVTAQDAATTSAYTVTVTRAPLRRRRTRCRSADAGQQHRRSQYASVEVHKAQRGSGSSSPPATPQPPGHWRKSGCKSPPGTRGGDAGRQAAPRVGAMAGIDHCDPDEPLARHGLEGVHRPCGPETSAEHDLRSRVGGRGATGEVQSRESRKVITRTVVPPRAGALPTLPGAYASGSWSDFRQSLMVAVQGAAVSTNATPSGLTGWFASTPAAHDVRDVHGPDRIQRSDQHLAGGDAGSRHSGIRRARGDRQARSEERRPVGRQGRSRGRGRSRHHRGGRSRVHRDGRRSAPRMGARWPPRSRGRCRDPLRFRSRMPKRARARTRR